MKKTLLILLVPFLAALAFGGYVFVQRLDNINFRAVLATYLAQALESDTLAAEMEGQTVPLDGTQADRLLEVLSWGKTERRWLSPAPGPEKCHGKITLYMGDMTLSLYALSDYNDAVAIERDIDGKTQWYFLEKYNLFMWVKKATGLGE